MDISELDYDDSRRQNYLDETLTGNSVAYPVDDIATVMLSGVTGGSARVQWTMSRREKVADDTAKWHEWSADSSAAERGTVFDGPITFIRVLASTAQTRYNLEVRVSND